MPPSTPPPLIERRRSLTHHLSSSSPFAPSSPRSPRSPSAARPEAPPTLSGHPLLALRLFSAYMCKQIGSCVHTLAVHPVTALAIYPLVGAYFLAKFLDVDHHALDEFEKYGAFAAWWLLLGILSSIGLGSGLHSGVLFLFPHFLKVCLAAERCGHVAFDVREDSWLRNNVPHCAPLPAVALGASAPGVPFLDLFRKVAASAVLWGAGTAIGEIPPYLFAFAAAATPSRTPSPMLEPASSPPLSPDPVSHPLISTPALPVAALPTPLRTRIADAAERCFATAVEQHGFLAVLALASWPNALFDFCGLACGRFRMPFSTFFSATLLGKGVIKVLMQSAAVLAFFSKPSREKVLAWLQAAAPAKLPGVQLEAPPGDVLRAFVERGILRFQDGVAKASDGRPAGLLQWVRGIDLAAWRDGAAWKGWLLAAVPDTFKEAWTWAVTALLLWFLLSLVDSIAAAEWNQRQAEEAKEAD